MMLTYDEKKSLYESIMQKIAASVKKMLTESSDLYKQDIIAAGRPEKLYSFETDREELWYNIGLYDGATAKDLDTSSIESENDLIKYVNMHPEITTSTELFRKNKSALWFARENNFNTDTLFQNKRRKWFKDTIWQYIYNHPEIDKKSQIPQTIIINARREGIEEDIEKYLEEKKKQ